MSELPYCPLCKRVMITGPTTDEHHWIPRTFGGKEKGLLHTICHRKLHSVFSEREMLKYYNTVEHIMENEHIRAFIKWVQKKNPEFCDSHNDQADRKRKRR